MAYCTLHVHCGGAAVLDPLFFLVTGLAMELKPRQIVERARELYLPLQTRNILFWVPVQFGQCAFIEPDLQLPFVCVAGLVWNIILSNVAGSVREWRRRNEKRAEGAALHGPRALGAAAPVDAGAPRQTRELPGAAEAGGGFNQLRRSRALPTTREPRTLPTRRTHHRRAPRRPLPISSPPSS